MIPAFLLVNNKTQYSSAERERERERAREREREREASTTGCN